MMEACKDIYQYNRNLEYTPKFYLKSSEIEPIDHKDGPDIGLPNDCHGLVSQTSKYIPFHPDYKVQFPEKSLASFPGWYLPKVEVDKSIARQPKYQHEVYEIVSTLIEEYGWSLKEFVLLKNVIDSIKLSDKSNMYRNHPESQQNLNRIYLGIEKPSLPATSEPDFRTIHNEWAGHFSKSNVVKRLEQNNKAWYATESGLQNGHSYSRKIDGQNRKVHTLMGSHIDNFEGCGLKTESSGLDITYIEETKSYKTEDNNYIVERREQYITPLLLPKAITNQPERKPDPFLRHFHNSQYEHASQRSMISHPAESSQLNESSSILNAEQKLSLGSFFQNKPSTNPNNVNLSLNYFNNSPISFEKSSQHKQLNKSDTSKPDMSQTYPYKTGASSVLQDKDSLRILKKNPRDELFLEETNSISTPYTKYSFPNILRYLSSHNVGIEYSNENSETSKHEVTLKKEILDSPSFSVKPVQPFENLPTSSNVTCNDKKPLERRLYISVKRSLKPSENRNLTADKTQTKIHVQEVKCNPDSNNLIIGKTQTVVSTQNISDNELQKPTGFYYAGEDNKETNQSVSASQGHTFEMLKEVAIDLETDKKAVVRERIVESMSTNTPKKHNEIDFTRLDFSDTDFSKTMFINETPLHASPEGSKRKNKDTILRDVHEKDSNLLELKFEQTTDLTPSPKSSHGEFSEPLRESFDYQDSEPPKSEKIMFRDKMFSREKILSNLQQQHQKSELILDSQMKDKPWNLNVANDLDGLTTASQFKIDSTNRSLDLQSNLIKETVNVTQRKSNNQFRIRPDARHNLVLKRNRNSSHGNQSTYSPEHIWHNQKVRSLENNRNRRNSTSLIEDGVTNSERNNVLELQTIENLWHMQKTKRRNEKQLAAQTPTERSTGYNKYKVGYVNQKGIGTEISMPDERNRNENKLESNRTDSDEESCCIM